MDEVCQIKNEEKNVFYRRSRAPGGAMPSHTSYYTDARLPYDRVAGGVCSRDNQEKFN